MQSAPPAFNVAAGVPSAGTQGSLMPAAGSGGSGALSSFAGAKPPMPQGAQGESLWSPVHHMLAVEPPTTPGDVRQPDAKPVCCFWAHTGHVCSRNPHACLHHTWLGMQEGTALGTRLSPHCSPSSTACMATLQPTLCAERVQKVKPFLCLPCRTGVLSTHSLLIHFHKSTPSLGLQGRPPPAPRNCALPAQSTVLRCIVL